MDEVSLAEQLDYETRERQRLTAELYRLRSGLEHILQEARLALEGRDNPNIEMALKRIRQAESAIR